MVYTKIIEASLLLPTPGGYVITPVSLFLCLFVSRITQKLTGRFWWNIVGRWGTIVAPID